jgi:hypothetical protein
MIYLNSVSQPLTIKLNGKIVDTIKDLTIDHGLLTFHITLLEDPGYGSGFPCYKFEFESDIGNTQTLEVFINNMSYSPIKVLADGHPLLVAKRTRIKELGI